MEISLPQVAEMLHSANTIVLTAHVHPDGDSLGSMLALYEALQADGKKVYMLLDDVVPATYHFLPNWKKISKPVDNDRFTTDLLVHHISNTRFADYYYIDSKAAATGEIILALLNLMKSKVTADIGTCLYTAIATDCGFFRYANTTASTLQPDLLNDPDENTEGFINYARSIEGVEIAILFRAIDERTVRISFRSHRADVSQVALTFGGGGHIRAAGCTIHDTLENAIEQVLPVAIAQIR
ncbi:MAG: phosphoesterase RecJ domain protein [Anaerospora sp.]|nr:phosphoesterase RecJ domain protein [Anaerospora sp.]